MELFGFTVIDENDDGYIIRDSRGVAHVDRKKPYLWFDEVSDAIQMSAKGVLIGGPEQDC